MTEEYSEVSNTIGVPANTGVEGFIRTLRLILKKPRVQQVTIDARGQVSYRRYVREGEDEKLFTVSFEDLQPYYIVRNAEVRELTIEDCFSAPIIIGMMFDKVVQDRLYPVSFVVGAESHVWSWYERTAGWPITNQEYLFGLPVLSDRHIPDSVLLLCAGFGADSSFVDTRASYKIDIPSEPSFKTQVAL
jgi:hypothetical protein